tara:strand:+ start:245 stop:544 length:300 start_codon:yes stop_codon:yes gene_type:complete
MVKFIEVFEATRTHTKNVQNSFSLREIFINPQHVVCVRSDPTFKRKLLEGVLPEGLDNKQEFSRVYLNRGQAGLDVVVVGDPAVIEGKLDIKSRKILKG